MSRALLPLACLALLGCKELTGSFGDVIALQVDGPPSRRVEEGTTLQLDATALDATGDTLAADVRWAIIDTAVGITLDTASGLVTAVTPGGPWRVQARVGTLRASPVSVTVTGAPDSLGPVGDTVLTAPADGNSPAMSVRVADLTTSPGTAPGLGGVPIRFVVTFPLGAGVVLRSVSVADSLATADSVTILTNGTGQAAALLRATGSPLDSVLVEARVTTATGGAVTGSPVRFTVRFQ